MREVAKKLYDDVNTWHDEIYNRLDELKKAMSQLTPEELADLGYFFRESSKFTEAVEKEFRRLQEIASKLLCVRTVECGESKFTGLYATAEPDVKFRFDIPSGESPRYDEFIKFLGVTDHPMISLGWKRVQAHLNSLVAEGVRIPESLDKKQPDYSATVFRKRVRPKE